MKRRVLTAMVVAMAFLMIATPVFARGPTNVEGIPWNDDAWWHSGQYIGPEMFGCGTETTIVLDDVTIVVDDIPMAVYDTATGEWTGTHLMWKGTYPDPYGCPVRLMYKFWLNGSGPVRITFYYAAGGTVEEYATEFIFFGVTVSDCAIETIRLQAYK